jgi:hypothetical protein
MTVASIITIAFVAALASSNARTENQTTALLLIGTIGAGYIENLALPSTAYLWDPADMGLVTGGHGAIRMAISAIATSMYPSILNTESAKHIRQYVMPAALGAGLPNSSLPVLFLGINTADFSAVPDATPAIIAVVGDAVKHAYSRAFRTVLLCTLPFGALLLVAAISSPNVEQYLTDDVARRLHDKSENPLQGEKIVDEH